MRAIRSTGGKGASEFSGRETLRESYPALPASVTAARTAICAAAMAAGATAEQLDSIRLASSEAVTNAILHAYGERPGRVYVSAAEVGAELCVVVSDDGGGLLPRSERSGLGFGLALIAHACGELAIVTGASSGTEVRMRFPVGAGLAGEEAVDAVAQAAA